MSNKINISSQQKKYLKVKRALDVALSSAAIVVLSPVLGGISLAIKLDSPGPVLFKQKRVGKNKETFEIYKFRSMRTDTPKDMPTHMLQDPDAFITKTGKFLRKTSLDELPQLFNILKGEMSIVGPRPALWNQDDLVAERDKNGANDVTPGLTGWAQINGRDELEIPVKAQFDGEYVDNIGPLMDAKCFLGTIGSVLNHDGVVEGGTGELHKAGKDSSSSISKEKLNEEIRTGAMVTGAAGIAGAAGLYALWEKSKKSKTDSSNSNYYNRKAPDHRDNNSRLPWITLAAAAGAAGTYALYKRSKAKSQSYREAAESSENQKKNTNWENVMELEADLKKKKILITGANSYIGTSVEEWLNQAPELYEIDTLDMIGDSWKNYDFSGYDTVFHVAGIAHNDVSNPTEEQKQLYYKVNTDLAIETAKKAKENGVKQFIFMSSMIVYSGCNETKITKDTKPKPENFYGDSKWQADKGVRELEDDSFKVVVIRPPMIYGKGSKGNFPILEKLAKKLPVFPEAENQRSMLYIDNLCQFVKLMIDNEESGIFFPQNAEYSNTSDLVQIIASLHDKNILMIPFMDPAVKLMQKVPGKIGKLADKAFGDQLYDQSMSEYKENYRVASLLDSIVQIENESA